jgi:hypothetical protein
VTEAKLIHVTRTATKYANKSFLSRLGGFSLHFSLWAEGRLWIGWVSRTFSSSCACVCAFRLFHTLCIGWQFNEFSGISNTHSSLGFGIPLLHWILLVFLISILRVVGLIIKALLGLVIFLDLFSFAGLLKNNLQLPNPP